MTGQLHEMSRAVGRIEAQIESIVADVLANRENADRRYADSAKVLKSISARLDRMEAALSDVPQMKSDVASMKVFYARLGGVSAGAMALVGAAGWLVWSSGAWLVSKVDWTALLKAVNVKL